MHVEYDERIYLSWFVFLVLFNFEYENLDNFYTFIYLAQIVLNDASLQTENLGKKKHYFYCLLQVFKDLTSNAKVHFSKLSLWSIILDTVNENILTSYLKNKCQEINL